MAMIGLKTVSLVSFASNFVRFKKATNNFCDERLMHAVVVRNTG
jgi:hypothetical protein